MAIGTENIHYAKYYTMVKSVQTKEFNGEYCDSGNIILRLYSPTLVELDLVSNIKEISSFYNEDQIIKMLYLILSLQSIKIAVYTNHSIIIGLRLH